MKYSLKQIIFVLSLAVFVSAIQAQKIKEVKPPNLSSTFNKASDHFSKLYETDKTKAIEYLDEVMPEIKSDYEKFNLIYWKGAFCATLRLQQPTHPPLQI